MSMSGGAVVSVGSPWTAYTVVTGLPDFFVIDFEIYIYVSFHMHGLMCLQNFDVICPSHVL